MPTRIVADPEGGFPGKIEDGGTWVQGFYKMVAYAYGPGEIPRLTLTGRPSPSCGRGTGIRHGERWSFPGAADAPLSSDPSC